MHSLSIWVTLRQPGFLPACSAAEKRSLSGMLQREQLEAGGIEEFGRGC
jgi:hypothetical protein